MKRIWFCLISVLMLVSCSDEIPENPIQKGEGRTLLAYIVSNNEGYNLDADLKNNVLDMYKGIVARREPSTLLIYYRPYSDDKVLKNPSILKFVSDGKGTINGKPVLNSLQLTVDNVIRSAEIYPFTDLPHRATDPVVMTKVLKEMLRLAPADHYGLTMGSHGTGWLPGNSVKARSFGDDKGYSIDIPELADVLEDALNGIKLDFILFDACMMANAEVAYELREVTDHVIASVLETPAYGFPYAAIINDLYSPKVNYQGICDAFIQLSKNNKSWGTCAAIDCNKMEELSEWVKKNLASNKDGLTTEFPSKVVQYGRKYSFDKFSYDVVDIFRQLEGKAPVELLELMDKVVIAKNCIEDDGVEFPYVKIDKDRFCGMGMYLPYITDKPSWDNFYLKSFAWSNAVEWTNYRP